MATFKEKIFNSYPIPFSMSIWGGDTRHPALYDWDTLVEGCIDELSSDLFVTESIRAAAIQYFMPKDCVSVISAKLAPNYPFQGNRDLKWSYDKSNNKIFLNYYPAVVTYRRYINCNDIDSLKGDRLRYLKAYILWQMAVRELGVLKPANYTSDLGQLDLSMLEAFRDEQRTLVETLKPEILVYGTTRG